MLEVLLSLESTETKGPNQGSTLHGDIEEVQPDFLNPCGLNLSEVVSHTYSYV